MGKSPEKETVKRFGKQYIIQHLILLLSVLTLIITGFYLWFMGRPEQIWWSQKMDGIETIRLLHRIAGTVLTVLGIYHLGYITLTREGRRELFYLLPRVKDVTDLFQNLAWFLHLRKSPPRFDRFTYYEKFDYWAVYWGCVIMIGTGLVLWFDRLNLMPYELAAEIHADEAILATLAIFIWHFYNVHYKPGRFPGSTTWLNGRISKEEMLKDHPLEFERLQREQDTSKGSEETLSTGKGKDK